MYDSESKCRGDRTLFEVINGLFKNNNKIRVPIGQIPVETGNSFIKDIGISGNKDALDKKLSEQTEKLIWTNHVNMFDPFIIY